MDGPVMAFCNWPGNVQPLLGKCWRETGKSTLTKQHNAIHGPLQVSLTGPGMVSHGWASVGIRPTMTSQRYTIDES